MKQSLLLIIFVFSGLMLQFSATAQPVDVTDSITNPSFELDGNKNTNITGWSNPNSFQTQNNTAFPYKGGTYYCEKWQSSGGWTDIGVSQTLKVMPNGLYRLTAAALSDGGGAYIYANEDSTEVDAAGIYDVFFAVDADTIKLGFYVVNGSNYVTCDNFILTFYGSSYSSGLQVLVDSANAIITAAVDLGDYTTKTYADMQIAADSAQKIIDDVSSTTEDIFNGEAYIKSAISVYYKVLNLIDYEATWSAALPYDATGVITNPSFETNTMDGWTNPDGFATHASAQPFLDGTYFCERWQNVVNGGWADIGISQIIDYIPNGSYLLTVGGHAILQNSPDEYPGNAYFFANEDSIEVFEPNSYSVITEVTDNTITIGFDLAGTSGNWLAMDNFQLKYLGAGAPVIVVSESELTFDEVNPSHSFTVSGFNLLDTVIIITAPSGFDIDVPTVHVNPATLIADETTITVSMTDTAVFSGDITVSCGGFSETITIVKGTKEIFTPDPAKLYYIKLEGYDKVMGSTTTTPMIYDFDGSDTQLFTIVESDTLGEYLIKSSNNGYLHKSAASNWDMLFDTPTDSMLQANADYHFTFTPQDNGCQFVQVVNAVANDRYVGTNAGSTASGSTFYCDKTDAKGEILLRFVDPDNIDIEVSESYLTFDDVLTTGTFIITGNNSILADFAIEGSTGFSVDTTAASWNGETTITVTFDASAEIKHFITISTSGVTKKVRVLGYLNATTYSPLYTNTSNLISDPYCTDISVYDAWGDEQLITDTLIIYGGASCIGLPKGTNNSGSLDYNLDGQIESNTYYRTSFAYRTIGGTMHLTYDDFYVDNQDGEVNFFLPSTDGDWVVFDTIVSSGTLDDATQRMYLNTYLATATELYIDNYQLFVVPLHVVEESVAPTNTTTDEFNVAVQEVVGTVNITAPSGISVNPSTLATDAGTETVTVSYDNSVNVDGYIVLSDGVESDSIYVSATVVSGISKTFINDAIKSYINNGRINVDFSLEYGGNVQFTVYNLTGAVVTQQDMNLPAGDQHQILDAELSSGIYMLNIVKEGKASTVKLVK